MTPHFFNYGDTEVDTKNRRISHPEPGLQAPGASRHPFSCQHSDNHPIKSGTAQRTELLTELIRSTSFTLTIYTVPYPQGHSGPQANGHPLTATPFLFDRRDVTPVYQIMYQTFSDSLHHRQPTEASPDPQHTLAATEVTWGGEGSAPSRSYRTIWALDERSVENALQWWRVILIQNGLDQGFIHLGPNPHRIRA